VLAGVFGDEGVDRVSVGVRVVDLHERLPLLRQGVLREDGLNRALRLAGAAEKARLNTRSASSISPRSVDALLGVNDEDALELVDAVDWADVDAGAGL
jgi:hypothetical protein